MRSNTSTTYPPPHLLVAFCFATIHTAKMSTKRGFKDYVIGTEKVDMNEFRSPPSYQMFHSILTATIQGPPGNNSNHPEPSKK